MQLPQWRTSGPPISTYEVAALARVRAPRVLANAATPHLQLGRPLGAGAGKQAQGTQYHQNGDHHPGTTDDGHHHEQRRQTLPPRNTLRSGDEAIWQCQPQRPQHDPDAEQAPPRAILLGGIHQTQQPATQQPQQCQPPNHSALCDQSLKQGSAFLSDNRFGESRLMRGLVVLNPLAQNR